MTERERIAFSERLFDEIGLIDDRFIYEASTPYIPKKRSKVFIKVLLIAAALTLTFSIALGTLLTGALFVLGGRLLSQDLFPNKGNAEAEPEYSTLSDRLYALDGGSAMAKEDIDLFDSTPKIIWKSEGEKEYRVSAISRDEASDLTEKISVNSGTAVSSGNTSEEEQLYVWIAFGDGRVITPHLALSPGNVGYGELFEYEQEYEPSEELSQLIIDTVS